VQLGATAFTHTSPSLQHQHSLPTGMRGAVLGLLGLPLQCLRPLPVPVLLQAHRGRGDVGAEHRRLHRVPTKRQHSTARLHSAITLTRAFCTGIRHNVTYLNMTWSPTLKVRVTLIPGPGCGGGAVRKQTKHSSVWYTVEMKTHHRCSNCNYSSLQLLQMWRV
jgi:hypothetical protein